MKLDRNSKVYLPKKKYEILTDCVMFEENGSFQEASFSSVDNISFVLNDIDMLREVHQFLGEVVDFNSKKKKKDE